MFTKKKSGFTLMELLVVMSIIVVMAALSFPAMLKARKNTALKRAELDMSTLGSALAQVAQDTGYYCNLGALTQPTTPAFFDTGVDGLPGTADYNNGDGYSGAATTGEGSGGPCLSADVPPVMLEPKPYIDTGNTANQYEGTETTYWKGPYVTYDVKKLFVPVTNGGFPAIPASVPALTLPIRYQYAGDTTTPFPSGWAYVPWDTTGDTLNKDFVSKQISSTGGFVDVACTLLDPWGHPYTIAYSDPCVMYLLANGILLRAIWGEGVMVIYSAGPDGKLYTPRGSPTPRDASNRYQGRDAAYNGDDIIYKFR